MSLQVTNEEQQILKKVFIPPRPEALLKVIAEAKKPEPNVSVIAAAIAQDIGISAAVIQIVNSAAYRRIRKIESIDQAVMILGLKRLIPLIKAVTLKSSLKESKKLGTFWDRATQIATTSSLIAQLQTKTNLVDHAYLIGLFHEAGVPIMFQHFTDYKMLYADVVKEGWTGLISKEQEMFNTTHCTIGAVLAQEWQLSQSLVDIIYYQYETDGIFESGELNHAGLELLSILKLARHIIYNQHNPTKQDLEWDMIKAHIMDFWSVDEDDIVDIQERIYETAID